MWASVPAYLTAVALLIAAVATTASAAEYTNHTVGGPAGWLFNRTTNSSATKYSAWAAPLTFNLGDFLIFNTNTNQTVVQTYNATTYGSCTADDAADNDTFIFNSGAENFSQPITVAVPLIKVGPNYYFSDADDGAQCQQGMRFEIRVNEGSGLPPSLNQPPPPPYSPPPVAETPPVFQSRGGGQGESMRNGGERMAGGVAGAALIGAGLLGLGLVV